MAFEFITDLDGTLLNNDKFLSHDTYKFLDTYRKLIIATARSYVNIDVDLELFNPLIITMNGASILYKDTEIFNNELKESDLFLLINFAYCCDATDIILENNFGYEFIKKNTPTLKFFDNPLYDIKVKSVKSLIFTVSKKKVIPDKLKRIEKYYNVRNWEISDTLVAIEIQHKSATKLEAISWLLKNKFISNFLYFGDSDNDNEVLTEFPERFYALKNSKISKYEKVKNITEFDNNGDGVVKEIKKIMEDIRSGNYNEYIK